MESALKYLPHLNSVPVERRPEVWLNYVRKRSGNLSHRLFHTPRDICHPLFYEEENFFAWYPDHLSISRHNGKVETLQLYAARCIYARIYNCHGRFYPGGRDRRPPFEYHFGRFKGQKKKGKVPDIISIDVGGEAYPEIAFEDDPEFVSELEHIASTYHEYWGDYSEYRHIYTDNPLRKKDNRLTRHIDTSIFPYQITDPRTSCTNHIHENHCLTCSYEKPAPLVECPERSGFVWRKRAVWRLLEEHFNKFIFDRLLCTNHQDRRGQKSAPSQTSAFAQTRNACVLKLTGLSARQLMWLPYRFARTGPTLAIQCAAVIVQEKYQRFLDGPRFSLKPEQVLKGDKRKTTPQYSFLAFRVDLRKDRTIPPGVCRFILDVFYRFYVLSWVKHLEAVLPETSGPSVIFDPETVHEEEHGPNNHLGHREGTSYITFYPDDILIRTPLKRTPWEKYREGVLRELDRTTKQGKVIRWYPTWRKRFDLVFVQFKSQTVLFQ